LQVEKFKTSHLIVAGAVVLLLPALAYLIGTPSVPQNGSVSTTAEPASSDANSAAVSVEHEAQKAPEPRVEHVEIESGDNLMEV